VNPLHLTEDLQGFLRDIGKNKEIMNAGRSIRDLVLIYPIYVASNLLIVPPQMQDYLREFVLQGLERTWGIWQATLLQR